MTVGAARARQAPGTPPAPVEAAPELSRAERVQAAVPGLRWLGGDPHGVTRWDARDLPVDQAIPIPVDIPAVVRLPRRWDAVWGLVVWFVASVAWVCVGYAVRGLQGFTAAIVAGVVLVTALVKAQDRRDAARRAAGRTVR